jgi:hypothetical protein
MPTVVVHLMGEDPFVAEMEELPSPTDLAITLSNPRKRDGKTLHYLEDQTMTIIYPWHRISFIEIRPDEEARGEVDLFFRT